MPRFSLSNYLGEPASRATEFVFHTDSPALEGYVDQIAQALGEGVTVTRMPSFQTALESQQQQKDREEDLKAQYKDLVDMVNPSPIPTGSVQVFLLDEEGMGSGHAGSEASLKAVVRASLRDKVKVVAALTSSWPDKKVDVDSVVLADSYRAHGRLLKSYLSACNVQTCESLEELTEILKNC